VIHISASQIETYKLCPSKWAWQYIKKIKPTQQKGAEFGSELHETLAHYLDTGEITGAEDIKLMIHKAVEALLLPFPKSKHIKIEQEFKLPIDIDVSLVGKIDCVEGGSLPRVIDHKYLSNFNFCKTEEDLETDIQAIIYSYAFKKLWAAGEDWVYNKWIYYNASGYDRPKKVGPQKAIIIVRKLNEVEKQFNALKEIYIDPMVTALKTSASEQTLNYLGCEAYGGCPFKSLCKPGKKILSAVLAQDHATKTGETNMASKSSELIERLRKTSNASSPKNEEPAQSKRPLLPLLKKKKTTEAIETPIDGAVSADATAALTNFFSESTDENSFKFAAKDLPPVVKDTPPKKPLKKRQQEDGATTINQTPPETVKNLRVLYGVSVVKSNNENIVHLLDFLEPVSEKICKENNVKHWAAIQYTSKAVLITAVEEYLTCGTFDVTLVCQATSLEAQVLKDVLIKHAASFYEGERT